MRRLYILFELAAIALIGMLYFGFFLSAQAPFNPADMALDALYPNNRIAGVEHERLSGILIPVEVGLKTFQHVPTWNSQLSNGTPLINDAFNYLFNPFHSLPVLLLGALQGAKVAIIIALLLAGFNAWALAKAIGLGAVARVTAGALYMLSGGIIAKFHTGHFQLGLSLAWPPLVLAGLWWTLRTSDRRAPVLMAVAFGLLFFAGNIYYTLHTLICAAFITLLHLIDRTPAGWRWRWDRVRRVAVGGIFAVGLAALQFIPIWTVREFVSHENIRLAADGQLAERYEMTQAITNYLYPWQGWEVFEQPDFGQIVVVDYAYIGPTVFLLIALMAGVLLLNRERAHVRAGLAALVLALMMIVWGAAQTPILQLLYTSIPLLSEFRYVGRAHAIASLWWIILAAIAIDLLWRTTRPTSQFNRYDHTRLLRILALFVGGWLYLFAFSVASLSDRLSLTLSNTSLYTFFNQFIFTTFQQAAEALWWLVCLAVVFDTVLMIGHQLVMKPLQAPLLHIIGARGLRLAILLLALTAIADEMHVNSRLLHYGPPTNDFRPLYEQVRQLDPQTMPIVREPFSPSAYNSYYAGMRNFGLDEGWSPQPLPSILHPISPEPVFLPGWAIVSNEYGGAAHDLAQQYVDEKANERIDCITAYAVTDPTIDPCDLSSVNGAILYRLTDALPYAFVATEEQLLTTADTMTNATVFPAQVISQQQDTITVRAATPDRTTSAYLVIQEAQFPGWQAFADGVPVEPLAYENTTAIKLLPGEHIYTLRFQPPGFSAGVLVFFITVVVIGVYLRGKGDLVDRPLGANAGG